MAERKKLILIVSAAIIVVAALVGAGYFYYQYQSVQKQLQNNTSGPQEVDKLVEEVGKLIDLPKDELPTVATVTDLEKLRDQPFFRNAKNGDKVLVFQKAQKAILYDPVAKKIIEVSQVDVKTDPNATASATQNISSFKIVLRNGTSTTGLASRVETRLKKDLPDINVVSKENAANPDYDKTIIAVMNEQALSLAQDLSRVLNASVSALPKAEIQPKEGDVVVVIGEDNI
jgi:hypothetical protein